MNRKAIKNATLKAMQKTDNLSAPIYTGSTMSYFTATGKIPFPMMNDYMFRVVHQKKPFILKGLISSMLHMKPEDITDIDIRNPIILGESIQDKGFILDIMVCINHNLYVNIELQVVNEHNWAERSLSYNCRSFDNLYKGQDYNQVSTALHIGLLDFQPFEDNLEFYATYMLQNTKNQHLYSDKFAMYVVDLTHIDLATEEDKAYQIDQWARLFKATTWEELKMLTANNEYMKGMAQTLYECNDDFVIREQCYAREEEIKRQKYYKDTIAAQEQALEEKDAALQEKDVALQEKDAVLQEQNAEIARLRARLMQIEQ